MLEQQRCVTVKYLTVARMLGRDSDILKKIHHARKVLANEPVGNSWEIARMNRSDQPVSLIKVKVGLNKFEFALQGDIYVIGRIIDNACIGVRTPFVLTLSAA
ncbi:MAG: hypothetical protein A2941_02525 [Candidatus Yanofskybacteria bacterium RIFCSPLOWO2_01_FULL_49_17]|uniref:Uncharacterized protein n=1 Tax=Candidatus Yanofskybacteria bacterium RIFCSPLOWO2_01_FULL_49_17 TaxID=1802700 RepID=A0A1F8GTF7_9BACT|nr:MAG: hypothetical protein A2941_02525 [Candidatus Yanofskybacteria bacterium RIFCSPLOWO2_01_FULL_49_17]